MANLAQGLPIGGDARNARQHPSRMNHQLIQAALADGLRDLLQGVRIGQQEFSDRGASKAGQVRSAAQRSALTRAPCSVRRSPTTPGTETDDVSRSRPSILNSFTSTSTALSSTSCFFRASL